MEIPSTGRATIIENFDSVEIIVPAKRNGFVLPFLEVWLCAWLFGEVSVLKELAHGISAGPSLFMIVWLGGWTAGGVFAFRTFLWSLIGKEVITVGQGAITVDKKNALFYKAKTYDLHEAKNFRAEEEPGSNDLFGQNRSRTFFNLKNSGTIRFDYGMETIKFADSIYEPEANFILQKLRSKKLIA